MKEFRVRQLDNGKPPEPEREPEQGWVGRECNGCEDLGVRSGARARHFGWYRASRAYGRKVYVYAYCDFCEPTNNTRWQRLHRRNGLAGWWVLHSSRTGNMITWELFQDD